MESIEKYLNGPGFFRCERFHCTMATGSCLARQAVTLKHWGNNGDKKDMGCDNCAQGRELAGLPPMEERARVVAAEKDDKEKRCSKCGQVKPLLRFYTAWNAPDKRQSWCINCTKENDKDRKRKAREAQMAEGIGQRAEGVKGEEKATTKACKKCGEVKALDDFHGDKGARGGKKGSCKICETARVKEWKRKGQAEKKTEDRGLRSEVEGQKNGETHGIEISEVRLGLYVDFTGREDLLKRLEDKAFKEFRTPADQVLSWINTLAREDRHEIA
jgi:hypothetical protein